MPDELTLPQKKALVALSLLEADRTAGDFHGRWSIAFAARGEHGPSYPIETILALHERGYAEPAVLATIDLVLSKTCTCACDRWRITATGTAALAEMNVKHFNGGVAETR